MGFAEIRNLLEGCIKEVEISQLSGKIIAIDAFNAIYQFLTAIRQEDGTPLMDSKGRITSHLSGLFYRTKRLIENGIKPVYVFDGKNPEFKKKEIEIREEIKRKLEEKYKKAIELGIKSEMKKYSVGTVKLTPEIIEESKMLLEAMGVPYIQAPSEADAQLAKLVNDNVVDFASTQDYDILLFGAKRSIRNLVITGKRKVRGVEVEANPEILELEKILNCLKLNKEKLIWLALIVGTDYNPEGIPGIGLKTAYELVKRTEDPEKLFKYVGWEKYYNYVDWKELYEFFLNPPCIEIKEIKWGELDEDKIMKLLVDEHDFNEERVKKTLDELKKAYKYGSQKSIIDFLKK
ncbi:MAG: flap endonuclease-1 [Candidatus Aenigmatarchaeota archaeon]